MSPANPSMAADYGPARHRSLTVEKADNGFMVRWSILVEKSQQRGLGEPPRVYTEMESRTSVFYTLPEVLDFVAGYFTVPAEDLGGASVSSDS